jgi:hypothetical protein
MGLPARSVRNISTLASVLGTGAHSRHVRQFQLASLELERTRRTHEKQAALRRMRDVDARLAEIEALIRKHQAALAVPGDGGPAEQCPTASRSGDAPAERRRVLRY